MHRACSTHARTGTRIRTVPAASIFRGKRTRRAACARARTHAHARAHAPPPTAPSLPQPCRRLRRSSALMEHDPYTLVVAPTAEGSASGTLYLDPGDGYGYRSGEFHYRRYTFESGGAGGTLNSTSLHAASSYEPSNELERVEILWDRKLPASATLRYKGAETALTFHFAAESGRLVVRKPAVPMAADWTIALA